MNWKNVAGIAVAVLLGTILVSLFNKYVAPQVNKLVPGGIL